MCYLLVISTRLRQSTQRGKMRSRRFGGTSFELRKLIENAPTPTTIAPALARGLGACCVSQHLPIQ